MSLSFEICINLTSIILSLKIPKYISIIWGIFEKDTQNLDYLCYMQWFLCCHPCFLWKMNKTCNNMKKRFIYKTVFLHYSYVFVI